MSAVNFKKPWFIIFSVILTLGLSISLQSLLAAWTSPLANPPTCAAGNPGCDAPLNTGALMQTKGGPLWINTGISPTGLIVEKGNVGIGSVSPGYKLDVNGSVGVAGDMVENQNYGLGLVGIYSPYRYSNVYSMGPAYRLAADGTTAGNLYGIAYSYEPNYGGVGNNAQAKSGLGHQYLIMANGSTVTALGTGIWTSSNIQAGGNIYPNGQTTYGLKGNDGYFDTINTGTSGDPLEVNYRVAGDLRMYNGDITMQYGRVLYPGSVSLLGDFQKSYYIASHASWGIYTNTSFNAEGGLYSRGSAVLTAAGTSYIYSCPYVEYSGGCYGWMNTCSGQASFNSTCKSCSAGVWVDTACSLLGRVIAP